MLGLAPSAATITYPIGNKPAHSQSIKNVAQSICDRWPVARRDLKPRKFKRKDKELAAKCQARHKALVSQRDILRTSTVEPP